MSSLIILIDCFYLKHVASSYFVQTSLLMKPSHAIIKNTIK